MKLLISNVRRLQDDGIHLTPPGAVALADGHILALGPIPEGYTPDLHLDGGGHWLMPGLVDLAVRLREPGQEHKRMLASELSAAVAGGVTSVACLPDTDPVLDEPGLVDMLRTRADQQQKSRVFPLGALTRNLKGEVLSELATLTEAGCVGFSQADTPIAQTQVLHRALQYASTFDHTLWLRPQDPQLGRGVAASGPLATRLGLAGVPVAAETIALFTLFEFMRAIAEGDGQGPRVHLCRLSSAAGIQMLREAQAQGLRVTADVSIQSLHLVDVDIGYFDTRMRLNPPLRQVRDRDALRQALADGTLTALVSDHTPVGGDGKSLPFAEAEPGATGLELLLSLALHWAEQDHIPLGRLVQVLCSGPAAVLGPAAPARLGQLVAGAPADLCVVDPAAHWQVTPGALRSKGKQSPFMGHELPGRVCITVVGGRIAHQATA